MTAKEYLAQLHAIKSKSDGLFCDLAFLSELQKSENTQEVSERADKLRREIEENNDKLLESMIEIKVRIERLDNADHVLLLKKKYIESKSIEQISNEMYYCERQIYRMLKEAYSEFARKNKDVI